MTAAIERARGRALDPDGIKRQLHENCIRCDTLFFDRIGSTNDHAKLLSQEDRKDPILILAEQQTRGRGRHGRQWHSEPYLGLWFSVLFPPCRETEVLEMLPIAAGVAVAKAIEKCLGMHPKLKWPNDLLINGKKFCGILCEHIFEGSKSRAHIVGIGMNTDHQTHDFKAELRESVTSLGLELCRPIDRVDVLCSTMWHLLRCFNRLRVSKVRELCREWHKRAFALDHPIEIMTASGEKHGIFKGIDSQGRLILDENGVDTFFKVGEVLRARFTKI